jgi:hypothetical protein
MLPGDLSDMSDIFNPIFWSAHEALKKEGKLAFSETSGNPLVFIGDHLELEHFTGDEDDEGLLLMPEAYLIAKTEEAKDFLAYMRREEPEIINMIERVTSSVECARFVMLRVAELDRRITEEYRSSYKLN